MEKYKEAIIDLTKLFDIEPNNKFALSYLEKAYHLTKEVIIDLAKLLGIEPSDGIDESLKKKLIEAFNICNNVTNIYTLKDLENLLEIKQDSALKFRVKFNFIMKRYEDAIVDLTKLLDIEQNNKFALRYRGEAYHLTERYKEAIIDLTKLLGNDPNDDVDEFLRKKWIDAFHMCNNTTNTYTLEDLENSLKIEDDALKFRVKFNFIMKRYEEAIIDLTKLLDIEPNNKFVLRYRAEAYYLMEKYKESFNDVNKLLKINTSDEWASKLLAKIIEKE